MDISIGLPNTIDVDGPTVVAWARRAEERGFRALATIDRIVYPTYDSLTALAVAAGATSRIGLFTNILLTPLYPPAWLAKATASLHAMSGGRLILGLGVGGRADDFAAMERNMARRGQLMDQALDVLGRAWAGESVTGDEHPVVPGAAAGTKVPVLIGGGTDAAVERIIRYGDGWTGAAAAPDAVGQMIEKVRRAWQAAGREGQPRFSMLIYFGLGDEKASRASLQRYYSFLGEWADTIADSAIRTPQAIKDTVRAYADAGVTEVAFIPTVPSLDEVDRLADAAW
jgi:alkanesulfonate monooxygenase SsuD/methylene tetrahydromethanopterin reductase-like flavin-dependent oxidoreductase (luciferase family)